MGVEVKTISETEYDDWYPLWQGYLTFYETGLPDEITENNWRRFFDDSEPVGAFGAYVDGDLVGFVHYIYHRTNWAINDICYLQDLFALPEMRGKGVGRALIEAVFEVAKENGCKKVYWQTQNKNKTARRLYDKMARDDGFMIYEKAL